MQRNLQQGRDVHVDMADVKNTREAFRVAAADPQPFAIICILCAE